MKIDPERLSSLREEKGLSQAQLARMSGIAVRTIRRMEKEPDRCKKTREDSLARLAKALAVDPGVLTGELPAPKSGKEPHAESGRVRISAQVSPKARLAYDLVRRRYGVSATEIINMAPLFFALLAEGSLDRRRERLKEACEAIGLLGKNGFELHPDETIGQEEESIANADVFGEQRLSGHEGFPEAFYPIEGNPFAEYLRKLDPLAVGEIEVVSSRMNIGYRICLDELKEITNGSYKAYQCLSTGHARISDIPEKLMTEGAGEERARWLEERMPEDFKEGEWLLEELFGVGPREEGADQ